MATEMGNWHKSSYSAGSQNCVEVREHADRADVRDTKNRQAGHITVSAPEWNAFLQAIRDNTL
ncbi:DUF397 domain-containing protein [Allonocardiopsis opalescens]|uniref:Uncharacterized protein DUF397 n=1 Tax=Allonocardiopsis opalescens TaxID=1144618 RepID=A0A2T0Q8B5_9ACTN|nr:DUF397 domain-containing protein [Allonocardiopsis opalescens]PRY00060.1 uncharacterized protein DUF397 [Allonocardiopsis opalescens]